MKYKRILLKLSGEALGSENALYDYDTIAKLIDGIMTLQQRGHEIIVVIGAGNIWRYRDHTDSNLDRVTSDHLGMMAGVMNAVVFGEKLKHKGVDAEVYTVPVVSVPVLAQKYTIFNARTALEEGKVVLCAGGEGHPFATHDGALVLRGLELQCDLGVKCTNADGVYDKDPNKYDDAVRLYDVSYGDVLAKDLKFMDAAAVAMARDNRLPIYICHLDQIVDIATDQMHGTLLQ